MTRTNKPWYRMLTLALVFMLVANLFVGALPTAFAASYDTPKAGDTAQISVSTRITRSDNGAKYQIAERSHEIRDFHFSSGNYDPGLQLYCIEYGRSLPSNPVYTAVEAENNSFWNRLGYYNKQGILLTLGFGYPASSIEELGVNSEYDAIAATQALVWEFATGARVNFSRPPANTLYYNAYIANTPAYNAYWKILELADEYTSQDGYNFYELLEQSNFLIWQYPNCQTLMAYSLPGEALPKWNPYGALEVQKYDTNNNPLEGAVFSATGANGDIFLIGPTDSNGYATTGNIVPYGTYTIKELVFPHGYTDNGQSEWTVVLSENSPGGIEKLTVANRQMFGSISVSKGDENGNPLDGVTFTVYNDWELKNAVGAIVTDANGIGTLSNLPSGYMYYVRETATQHPDYNLDLKVYEALITNEENVWINNGEQITNYLSTGAIGVKKANERGEFIQGAIFGVYTDPACTNEVARLTTDVNGEAFYGIGADQYDYTLRARTTYYIKELQTADEKYILDTTIYAVTVRADRMTFANNNVSITNYLKPGAAAITKHNENGTPIEGAVFGVYFDPECKYRLESITTDANGNAYYGIDVAGNYTLDDGFTVYLREDLTKDASYIIDSTVYPVTIKAGELTKANNGNPVVNVQKKWQITVEKRDSVSDVLGTGDTSVVGSVYGLYDKNGTLLKEYTVGAGGSFTTDIYVSDIGYYFQEISVPAGYQLDPNRYYMDEYSAPTCLIDAFTSTTVKLTNDVMTGTISINKFTEDPNAPDQFVIPESGAVFEIYLKAAGSYENAERLGDTRLYDRATVNENGSAVWSTGTAISKELSYGTYIVHQVSGWNNREMTADFEVVIDADGKHVTYDLNNPYIGTRFTINKRDSESKKLIVNAVAKFSVKNVATGELVKFVDPATNQEITVFETVNGVVSIPMEIPYGTYEVIEVEAPAGYAASDETVKFTVDANSNGVSVDVYNEPLKGVIEVEKTGPQFVSVTTGTSDFGAVSVPKFENTYLAGVVFNVVAAEDIVTADGETHYKKGDIVDVITTNATGAVKSDALYCGKYTLIERETPVGYYADSDSIAVEVKNDGTNKVVVIPVSVKNDRVQTEITLSKEAMTWDVNETETEINRKVIAVPGVGFTFGVYAGEEFTAANGDKIAKDSLIAVLVTDENGHASYTKALPFGKYYVKELAAPNSHDYKLDNNIYAVELKAADAKENMVTVDINGGKPLVNDFNRFDVVITKTDLTSSEPVPGALIVIKNEAGEVLYKEHTDANGVLPGIVLEPGKYTFQEVVAPEGYVLNETVFGFEVGADGKVTGTTEFTNERVPVEEEPVVPEPPKTGDNTNMALWIMLMIVSALAVAALLFGKKKMTRS